MTRRNFLRLAVATGAFAIALSAPAFAQSLKEVRIGFQKTGVLLIAKAQKSLEKKLESQGVAVKWVEFSFGPPLLEALSAGSIDYGYTGDSPPIFAQAARANLAYVAAIPARGEGQAIIVPKDSPINSLVDLKGKRVGVAKASSAHNLLIAAIESAGLSWSDITPVYLAPADAGAAFARGAIDAWSIWDPFFAITENAAGARPLPVPRSAAAQNSFFLANRDFLTKHVEIVRLVNDEVGKATAWADANREETAKLYAAASGVDLAAQTRSVKRAEFAFGPLDEKVLGEQQAVANRFHRLGLIPAPINVRDYVWKWTSGS